MSISSVAEDSAVRLTKPAKAQAAPDLAALAETAAAHAAAAVGDGASAHAATQKGKEAALAAKGPDFAATVPAGPLAQLVKYIPTETLTLYVAVQAALGDVSPPTPGGNISDADFASRWLWMWGMLVVTLILTTGLSYRSQKNAHNHNKFTFPKFDVLAAGAAFIFWALSLPSTPLRDIGGYNYSAWNSVLILFGTVAIATAAYVLGKTVSWQKMKMLDA